MTTVSSARHLRSVQDHPLTQGRYWVVQDHAYRQQIHQQTLEAARQFDRGSLDHWALHRLAPTTNAPTQQAILLAFEDVWNREGQEILGRGCFIGRNVTRELDRTDIQNRALTYVLEDYRAELAEDHAGVVSSAVVRGFLSRQIRRAASAQAAQRRRAQERFSLTGWGDPRRPGSVHGIMENQNPEASVVEYPGQAVKPLITGMCSEITPPTPESGTAAAAETSAALPEDPLNPRTFPDGMDPLEKLIRVEQEQRLDQAIVQMASQDLAWEQRASVLKTSLEILRGGFVWPATSRKLNRRRPLVPGDFRAQLKHAAGVKWRAGFHRLIGPLEPWLVDRLD